MMRIAGGAKGAVKVDGASHGGGLEAGFIGYRQGGHDLSGYENRRAVIGGYVDAVEHEDVKMWIEI